MALDAVIIAASRWLHSPPRSWVVVWAARVVIVALAMLALAHSFSRRIHKRTKPVPAEKSEGFFVVLAFGIATLAHATSVPWC